MNSTPSLTELSVRAALRTSANESVAVAKLRLVEMLTLNGVRGAK